ncbi:MAG TPA: polysaccharide deacetylase family protein [Bryobacteraceae bacterium]
MAEVQGGTRWAALMIAAPLPIALKRIARFGLHRLGGLHPLIWNSRKQFRILTYHRFPPLDHPEALRTLDGQCAFLKRQFRPLSLSEIARSLDTGAPLPPGALAVTVDDGYRDFLADGFPIFQKWQIPVTVFLMTDFLDRKLWPWWNQVEYALLHGRANRVRLALLRDRAGRELPLQTEEQRRRAEFAIHQQVVEIPSRRRIEFVDSLADLFDVEIPKQPPPEHAALTWDEVRRLADAAVEFGSHTRTHPILPLEDEELVEEEIAGSKARIEQELGRPAIHFCYPNGDYNDAVVAAVARCGFRTAVTVDPGLNTRHANRYLLKRLSVHPALPDEYFREHIAGMHA